MEEKFAILLIVATMMTFAWCGRSNKDPEFEISKHKKIYAPMECTQEVK